ncbi:hypothetical protein [Streptomyces sp. H23]|uniref:hypothetical protein n=1 Tax=Streptomyces sp. H23 TaxID=2541723 RepID=UPI00106EDFFC|nr:hypothetical protein [Streptomyces sp. H23]
MPGTDDQETSTSEPEEPDQDREDRSTRKKLVTALVQAACAVVTSALGQVAGEALSNVMGLV